MKKLKKWLIKILKKILKKLEPNVFEEVTIAHSYKPLITLEENFSLNKRDIEKLPEGYARVGIIVAVLGFIAFFAFLVLCIIAKGVAVNIAILAVLISMIITLAIVGWVYLVLWLLS